MNYSTGGLSPQRISPHVFLRTTKNRQQVYFNLLMLGIRPTNLIDITNNKYKLILAEEALDTITLTDSIQKLRENEIEVIVTADTTYRRTLLVRNIEPLETAMTNDEITNTIEANNGVKVDMIIRLPEKSRLLKILLSTLAENDKIKNNGLILKYTKVPAYNITQEPRPYKPLICKKCYVIEEHNTSQCTTTELICSNCSQTGHRYDTCNITPPKCINCSGPHCPLVMSCPKVKEAVRKHRNSTKAAHGTTIYNNSQIIPGQSYASTTATSTIKDVSQAFNTNAQQETIHKIVLAASIADNLSKAIDPKHDIYSYVQCLEEMHLENKLPVIKWPSSVLSKIQHRTCPPLMSLNNDNNLYLDQNTNVDPIMEYEEENNKRIRADSLESLSHPNKKIHSKSPSDSPPQAPSPTVTYNLPTELPYVTPRSQLHSNQQSFSSTNMHISSNNDQLQNPCNMQTSNNNNHTVNDPLYRATASTIIENYFKTTNENRAPNSNNSPSQISNDSAPTNSNQSIHRSLSSSSCH